MIHSHNMIVVQSGWFICNEIIFFNDSCFSKDWMDSVKSGIDYPDCNVFTCYAVFMEANCINYIVLLTYDIL